MISNAVVFIYGLCDPDSHELRYVGKTKHLRNRLTQHLNPNVKSGEGRARWIKSLLDSGKKPEIFTLEECQENGWQEAEKFWISYLKSIGCNLVNFSDGGGGNVFYDPELRRRLGNSSRGKKRPLSKETIAKISASNKGKIRTPEVREKIRKTLTGRILTGKVLEANRRGALKRVGRKMPDSFRINTSLGRKGIKFSEEHLKNLSVAHIGYKRSPESLKKQSEAMKKIWDTKWKTRWASGKRRTGKRELK